MNNSPQAVKAQIPHTWPIFFTRHGNFTDVQLRAIPPIVAGRDVLLIAATATGKTEAVVAPLVERFWRLLRAGRGLTILYICPMRALVRDLHGRLSAALAGTSITVAMKTGDTGALRSTKPPSILITTPESADSLLTSRARLFTTLQAIVIDEIHLFDNSPRGDHLRCLLARFERIRTYAQPNAAPTQRVLLSATVPDPSGIARRYLHNGTIIEVTGGRAIVAEVTPLYDLAELVIRMDARAAHKSLLFCNTRDEVEQTAAYLRDHLGHDAQVFVHYGNLDGAMRQEVETRFAEAAVAVCVSTSTLELGIDIGSIDDVVLVGAPHSLTSFLQRIGRGGRRTDETHVLCMPKTPQEWARFESLLQLANGEAQIDTAAAYGFRPSILVQQIFSLIKQNPTGSIRLGDVRRVAPADVTSQTIRDIVAHLTQEAYLQTGRLGEWKADEQLQELIDLHEIYSNIGADVMAIAAVDAYTNKVVAHTNQLYEKGSVVLFGGRPMEVVWQDRRRFGLAPSRKTEVDEVLRFAKSHAAIPYDVTQGVARSLGLAAGEMATIESEVGTWVFHFWGTVWGELLAGMLNISGFSAETINEYALYVRPTLPQLPLLNSEHIQIVSRQIATTLSDRLAMGRFHALLPSHVALAAATQQLNLPAFEQQYRVAKLIHNISLAPQLEMLWR